MREVNTATCPLCLSADCAQIHANDRRIFLQCSACKLVFVPRHQMLSPAAELKRYSLHDNTTENRGYHAYLETVADEIRRIPIQAPSVLDFGCGSQAVLCSILRARGYDCTAYDPLYDIGAGALARVYDIVIVCEVIEHLRDLRTELEKIHALLTPRGHVVIRTAFAPGDPVAFARWHYISDTTHVNLFGSETFTTVAQLFQREIMYINEPVVVIGR